MNIHHILFFCFLSVLSDRNTGLTHAEMIISKTEGEDFRQSFKVDRAEGSRIYLCRNNCRKKDILVETLGKRATTGKYTIRYDKELYVTITELTLSDVGQYRFGVSNVSSVGSYKDFEVRIKERCDGGVIFGEPRVYSIPEGGNITITCSLNAAELNRKFLCREDCKKVIIDTKNVKTKSDRYSIEYNSSTSFTVSITQLTKSDSGRYRCGVGRQMAKNTCQEFEIIVTNGSALPLTVSLIAIGLLAAFFLLLCKWKLRPNCNYVNSRGTLTSRNTEHDPYYNHAPSYTLEDTTYETLDSPSSYEILNQSNTVYGHMYSTLGQQT